jgi:Flp pilus assembly protein TadG
MLGGFPPAPRNPLHPHMEAAMTRIRESGQALALAAVSLAVLLGFAGLAVDMGVLRYEKHLQQTAADAAAIAGAYELRDGSSYVASAVVSAGQNAASTNGFTDSSGSSGSNGSVSTCTSYATNGPVTSNTGASLLPVCVQINNPPQSGPHDGDSNCVEAYVAANHPTFFMKIFGITNEPVVARAVATLVTTTTDGCVYTLGQPSTGKGIGITSNGTPTVDATSCGFYDNGDWTTNGSKVNINAGLIDVAGSGTNNGGGTVTCSDSSACPSTDSGAISDPLSYLQGQAPPSSTWSNPSTFDPSNAVPGTYSSIDITGGNVTFAPGTYYVNGNFTINGNANVSGTGVTFYINQGSVTINGTGNVVLSAPAAGSGATYPDILFYQNPADTSAATIVGTSGSSFTGALYFPSATLTFGGTSTNTSTFNSGASYTLIVADNLNFNGTATIDLNAPGAGDSPIENAILVE